MTSLKGTELDDVESLGKEILPHRAAQIEDGRLNGRHWFIEIITQAKDILRRKEAWEARMVEYRTSHRGATPDG